MKIEELDYTLPKELIAQFPASPRDHSRLMVIDKKSKKFLHKYFFDLPDLLNANDVLVFNKTKVFPARVFGKKETGGKVEILLLKNINENTWEALTKPGLKLGQKILFDKFSGIVINQENKVSILKFNLSYLDLLKHLEKIGKTPLPPYINSKEKEKNLREKYQTIYAEKLGSAAAPTAGLHFTENLIQKLKEKGIQMEFVNLHVGLGTFEPVNEENLEDHKIHEEYFEVEKDTFKKIIDAKKIGKRIIAVGTTTTRVLETITPQKLSGNTNLFIYPPYKFKLVDGLITNFHLPKSTLLALVYAFAGKNLTQKAYTEAVQKKYRFFSFGDASLYI
jgi:S-adenosylmethionine:tRNA ribosyltransferase-isomerase